MVLADCPVGALPSSVMQSRRAGFSFARTVEPP
jgi:hypothetical protein